MYKVEVWVYRVDRRSEYWLTIDEFLLIDVLDSSLSTHKWTFPLWSPVMLKEFFQWSEVMRLPYSCNCPTFYPFSRELMNTKSIAQVRAILSSASKILIFPGLNTYSHTGRYFSCYWLGVPLIRSEELFFRLQMPTKKEHLRYSAASKGKACFYWLELAMIFWIMTE